MWEEVRHQVTIAGKVTGPVSGIGLGHVRVSIVDGPDEYLEWIAIKRSVAGDSWMSLAKRPDRFTTASDGHFHFMDLPDGDYILHAAFPNKSTRYGGLTQAVNVSRNAGGDIIMAQVDLILPATTIQGTVTRQGGASPVVMAHVVIIGSGENTFTDENGDYLLSGIEASPTQERIVTISATGYQDRSEHVAATASGLTYTRNVTLVPE